MIGLKQVVAGLILLAAVVCDVASAQVSGSGYFYTSSGAKVTYTYYFNFTRGPENGIVFLKPRDLSPVVGQPGELVNSDGDEPGHPNTRKVVYDTLRRARDQLRGLPRSMKEDVYTLHECDNPECAYEKRAHAAADPTNEKIANWAVGSYGQYLEHFPEDWDVMREFALAVGLSRDVEIATEVMHTAYLNDPQLAFVPIDMEFLGVDDRGLRELIVRCVKQAHRDPSAERWFLVSVLMQGEGRKDRAAEMLKLAVDAGLDESIAREMTSALN
tara:strand:- start:147493 stop:148308 length:816 start_codon:yes stop_codon:yes gene_type:complete